MRATARAGATMVIPSAVHDVAAGEMLPEAIAQLNARLDREAVVDYSLNFILGNRPYIPTRFRKLSSWASPVSRHS